MLASWASQTLRPASFRGVPFAVFDNADRSGGRAIVTHEFPLRDQPCNEDLGEATHTYQVEAVVVGDDVIDQAIALEVALDAPGPGTLVHPYYGTLQAVVKSARTSWRKGQGRVARFSITFVEDAGAPALQPTPAVSTPGLVAAACDLVTQALALAVAAELVVTTEAEDFVLGEVEAVVGDIQGAIGAALGVAGAALALGDPLLQAALAPLGVLTPAALSAGWVGQVVGALVGGATDAASLTGGWMCALPALAVSMVPPRNDGSAGSLAALLPTPVAPGGLVASQTAAFQATVSQATAAPTTAATPVAVAGLITRVAQHAGTARPVLPASATFQALLHLAGDGTAANPGYVPGPKLPALPASSLTPALAQMLGVAGGTPAALAGLPGVGPDQLMATLATPSRQAQAKLRLTLTVAVRVLAASEAARVASRLTFVSRNDADTALAELTASLDAASDQSGDLGWAPVWSGLTMVRAAAVRDLTVTEQPLPSLATFTPQVVLPAMVLAQQLYGDAPTTLFDHVDDLVTRNTIIHPGFVPIGPLEVLCPTSP